MGFEFVVLWTDASLWALFAAIGAYALRVVRSEPLRASWARVGRDAPALCAALLLLAFTLVTLLDSVHLRRALPPAAGQSAGRVFYDTRTVSVLDLLLARQFEMREASYSAPLAWRAFAKEATTRDGHAVREYPRLAYGGAHLADPQRDWAGDTAHLGAAGAFASLALAAIAL